MSGDPEVSIVTPTKNRVELLRQTIDSVCQQTFDNWELIVVDDGSDDGTAEEILRRAALDNRIRYCQRAGELRGANVCRNLGLTEARGEFVVFLDSDDLLEPSCLRNRVEKMNRNRDLDFALFQAGVFKERIGDLEARFNSQVFGDDLLRFLCLDFPWQTTAPIWRKSFLIRLGGFDETLPSWQDVDLHVRAICAGALYLRFSDLDNHVRWQFAEQKVSIQQRRSPDHLRAAEQLLAKFEEVVRNGPQMDWCRQRALCGLYFFLAERWVEIGKLNEALRCWQLASKRKLAARQLYWQGSLLLRSMAAGVLSTFVARLIHKWKGLVRYRINPELV